jgi:tellurite resistance protein
MGRRNSGSGAGFVVLVAFGLVFTVVSAIYEFILNNWAVIKAFCIVTALLLLLAYVCSKFGKPKQSAVVRDPLQGGHFALTEVSSKRLEVASQGTLPSPASSQRSAARWIDSSETVSVQGVVISGGFLYLGTALPLNGGTTNQYVVNPDLPAKSTVPDVGGLSVQYWPSYDDLPTPARRAYLDWMATGRSDPAYGISYVFLYLYGLEHRVFVEQDLVGAPAIIAEAERLLSIYGADDSFKEYAGRFVDVARCAAGMPLAAPKLSPESPRRFEIDVAARVYLGHRLSQSELLTSEDALKYVLSLPDVYLRTPAVRCFEEFVSLWHIRFRKRFPKGKKVATSGNIELIYRAASRAFEVEVKGQHQNLPDVAKATTSLEALKRLVEDCSNELDAFSRLVGRRPEARSSAQASLLLPQDLLAERGFDGLRVLGRNLAEMMGGQNRASTKMQRLLELANFEFAEAGKVSPTVATQLGQVLDLLDVAIEPDRRYGGAVPQLEDQVFLFSAPGGGPVDPERLAYRAMKAQVEVAVLAASADGDASSDEMQRVIAGVKDGNDLSGVEKARLIAFAVTIFNSPPKQARVLKLLAERSEAEREAIARAAIAVVGGNERIAPSEVRFLERLHKTLGLPQDRVYSELHRANPGRDEPVVISVEVREAGIAIPRETPPAAAELVSGIKIDAERLARTQKETAAVSDLLASIFEEEAAPPDVEASRPTGNDELALEGLDKPHTELIEMLELRGSVARSEFDQHARAMKLLPDGAIERINDWSFDQFEEPLLEEGDEILIAPHLRQRLAEMREATA